MSFLNKWIMINVDKLTNNKAPKTCNWNIINFRGNFCPTSYTAHLLLCFIPYLTFLLQVWGMCLLRWGVLSRTSRWRSPRSLTASLSFRASSCPSRTPSALWCTTGWGFARPSCSPAHAVPQERGEWTPVRFSIQTLTLQAVVLDGSRSSD